MAIDKKLRHQEDLTDADKAVLRLYEDAKTPIPWDSSDDAILSFAASIHKQSEEDDSESAEETEDSTVVPFRRPPAKPVMEMFRSPVVGLAIAASLLIGVIVGQAVIPQYDRDGSVEIAQIESLRSAEKYTQVLQENANLQAEIEDLRRLDTTPGAEELGAPLDPAIGLSELPQLFDSFDCATLNARTAADAGVVVEGYVATPEDLARLEAALGDGGTIVSRAEVAGAPFCGAIEILHRRTDVTKGSGGGPSVRPYNHGLEYRQGEGMVLAATASGHVDGYLYVDLILPDGQVRHLQPEAGAPHATVPAGRDLILGAEDGGIEISPPSGRILATVIASAEPLFEGSRSETEPADAYFADLNTALEAMGQKSPASVPMSNYSFITIRDEN
jgi:hypothetical protein